MYPSKEHTMAKMGRPPVDICWKTVNKLCKIQATLEEIAGWFDCSVDTIEKHVKDRYDMTFTEYHKKKSSKGKASLRRQLFRTAMSKDKGAVTAMIWLSKQYLGMKDRFEETNDDREPFIIETSKGEVALGIRAKRLKVE